MPLANQTRVNKQDYIVVIRALKELGIIEQPRDDQSIYRLTELIGYKFISFEDERKKKTLQDKTVGRGNWTKRNWLIADTIKVVIGLLLGFFIRIATEPTRTLPSDQIQPSQLLPKNPDTVRKN